MATPRPGGLTPRALPALVPPPGAVGTEQHSVGWGCSPLWHVSICQGHMSVCQEGQLSVRAAPRRQGRLGEGMAGSRRASHRDLWGWVMPWGKVCFGYLIIPFGLLISQLLTSLDFPILLLSTPVCIPPPPLPKQILIMSRRASPMYFQLCQGALGPLCLPAGAACCYYPALLLGCAAWFEGKHHAALCCLVTRR